MSYKDVIHVWDTAVIDADQGTLSLTYDGVAYDVTPEVVEKVLHLPNLNGRHPDNFVNDILFQFFRKLGYNGEFKKVGDLYRTKLKKEWNFFFDCISRCFLNKVSSFIALPSVSFKIEYFLIYNHVFDYGNRIL